MNPVAVPDSWSRDYGAIFHPSVFASQLEALCDPVLQLAQLAAVFIVIAGLASRLRSDEVQLESIASMMLRVAFISTVAWWRTLALETADAAADALGPRMVAGVMLSLPDTTETDRRALTPLQAKLGQLASQWSLASSPALEALDEARRPVQGKEEEWLAKGWNWARAAQLDAGPADLAWGTEAGTRRAAILLSSISGVNLVVRLVMIMGFLAESFRLLLFHAGFAVMPLLIAGLGTHSLGTPSLRGILSVIGVALWPLGWAFFNASTSAMAAGALDVLGKTAQAALYPKLADTASRTLALAAPHLSWTLFTSMAAITLAVCLWSAAVLCLAPWLIQRMLSAGARWYGKGL
jgi:hypothetical protein